jgi:hypothetical protein
MRGTAIGAWLLLGGLSSVLAGCGGRSQRPHGGGGTGGAAASGGAGGASHAGSVPSVEDITDGCHAVCEEAKSCFGFDYGRCLDDCALSAPRLTDTATCARASLKYVECVAGLPDVCVVFAERPSSTRCDQGAYDVGACLEAHCKRIPTPLDCRIAD